MKPHSITLRRLFALLALFACLVAPVAPVAHARDKKGEKEYKRGIEHEAAQRWEQAAQEFALAVAAKPSNIEYQLHYRRAIFNASQTFMMKGRSLAEREDYVGAYNAFRQSYGYDPVNQLALAEMERMMRLQRARDERGKAPAPANPNNNATATASTRRIPAFYSSEAQRAQRAQELAPGAVPERLRQVNYNSDLEALIRMLAKDLNLNVVFDKDFRKQDISLTLSDVTTAQALDIVFQTRSLFFQRLSRRTILVADQMKRPQYQPLELQTFYLKNIAPEEVQRQLPILFPPQGGRQTLVVPNKGTNSVTVRDTPENMRIIADVIRSLDKDRAAMVFDVQIYEVNRTDLLQLGGQLGNSGNIGGTSSLVVPFGGNPTALLPAAANGAAALLPTALATGLIIPSLQLSALQDKKNTRLLSSAQLHAFDGEDVQQRIGSRVPVQTASAFPFTGGNNTPGQSNNNVFGGGFPVINYEPVGLTINFKKPQVFPSADGDFDVQVQMGIKSTDVAGGSTATPTFSERELTGVARIKNNQTLMLASVAQNQEARGRQGLPLLGLIPILGRFISTPIRDDRNSDVVIAITPRVLRAPSITPEDEFARTVGSQQQPLSDSLASVVREADREDQLAREAAANNATQLAAAANSAAPSTPAQTAPVPQAIVSAEQPATTASNDVTTFVPAPRLLLPDPNTVSPAPAMTPSTVALVTPPPVAAAVTTATPLAAILSLAPRERQMRVGERKQFMLALTTEASIRMAIATLKFDPKLIAVRGVSLGTIGAGIPKADQPLLSHLVSDAGMLLASLSVPDGKPTVQGAGVLLLIDIEALAAGESRLDFDGDGVHLATRDDRTFDKRFDGAHIVIAK